jgi:hypothetical protein
MDVKSSFLHEYLQDIYMEQPPNIVQGDSNVSCKLNKSFYDHKKSSRSWYEEID